ncbi:MAG: acyl carrier protein [Burkholderiales bacterium]|jgi:acyl carrier protein|nr:acyl carrier protein [Burkholderiales bacterium]
MSLPDPSDKEALFQSVVNILHETFEIDKAKLTRDANLFTDLDIDSIDAVDLVVKLNALTGKRLQPESFKNIRTIDDVVNAIADLLKKE